MTPVGLRDAGEIERALTVAHDANGGLIVTVSPLATVHRDLIVSLAARYRVPAVYPLRYFAASGGLISYESKTPPIPPLFKADAATLSFYASKTGAISVSYQGWDASKVVLEGGGAVVGSASRRWTLY